MTNSINEEEFRTALGAGDKPVPVGDVQKIMFNFPEMVRPIESPEIIKPAGIKEVLALSNSDYAFTVLNEFPALYRNLRTLINAKDQQAAEDAKEYLSYLESTLGEALKHSPFLLELAKNNDSKSEGL